MTEITNGKHQMLVKKDQRNSSYLSTFYMVDGSTSVPTIMPSNHSIKCKLTRDTYAEVSVYYLSYRPSIHSTVDIWTTSENIIGKDFSDNLNSMFTVEFDDVGRYLKRATAPRTSTISSEQTTQSDTITINNKKSYDFMQAAGSQEAAMNIGAELYDAGISCTTLDGEWAAHTPSSVDLLSMLEVNFGKSYSQLGGNTPKRP